MSDFQRFLQEQMKDPEFRKFWEERDKLVAKAKAGEITWAQFDQEIDRLCGEE